MTSIPELMQDLVEVEKSRRMRFRIRQNNQTVASAEGLDIEAEAEIMHYARQYRQDGEITIQHNAEGHWKRYALLCQWPLPPKETP